MPVPPARIVVEDAGPDDDPGGVGDRVGAVVEGVVLRPEGGVVWRHREHEHVECQLHQDEAPAEQRQRLRFSRPRPDAVDGYPEEGDADALDAGERAQDEVEDDAAVDEVVQGENGLGVDEDSVHRVREGPVADCVAVARAKGVSGAVHRRQQEGDEDEKAQQGKNYAKDHLKRACRTLYFLVAERKIPD